MEQYMSKSALVAEIERRLGELSQLEKASYEIGLYDAYKIVLSFLDTLEVKKVDFDAEWERYFEHRGEMATVNVKHLAKYFFELGLKVAQKGD